MQSIREIVLDAASKSRALQIRGSGSKDFYGHPARGEVLDIREYHGVVDYEPSELVVTARAGTSLMELEGLLAQSGQELAFEPPRFGGGTLGGCIAAGLSGPRRAYAGAARDFVLGIRMLDGAGQDLSFGGRVIKNVAGYDVSRLMVGAMGTLGVLLEISLKVLPSRPQLTLRFECDESSAIQTMNTWSTRPLPLSATCYCDGALHARLSGSEPALRAARTLVGGDEVPDGATFWSSIRDQTAAFFGNAATLWRVSVPSTTGAMGLSQKQLIEWGGALRWIADEVDAVQLRMQVEKAGGHATLFRGDRSAAAVFHPLPLPLARLHRELKRRFDPRGILNPQRMYLDF